MSEIIKVESKKQLKEFIDFPHALYKNDPFYVPELFIAQKDLLTTHPFHKHSEISLFLSRENGKITGRIAGIKNNNYLKFSGENSGFFGFFDCVDHAPTSKQLFETAFNWLKSKNLTGAIGPVNFSTNETAGLLVEGFNDSPRIMMTYNKPYYEKLMEEAGFQKKMDLWAWKLSGETISEKALKLSDHLENRLASKGIKIRKVNLNNFKNEVAQLREIYNRAWESNWGFVPMTNEEFNYLAKDLKLILNPKLAFVAEKNGKAIGFSLTLPDLNHALKKVKRGRLLPFGIFNLLWHKNKTKWGRVLALGVTEEFRKLGIEAIFYAKTIQACRKEGIQFAEASWTLENNVLMNQALQNLNAEVYKKYRIFERKFY